MLVLRLGPGFAASWFQDAYLETVMDTSSSQEPGAWGIPGVSSVLSPREREGQADQRSVLVHGGQMLQEWDL